MVGKGGIEPPQPFDNGFTDRPSSPTLALTHILTVAKLSTFFVDNFNYVSNYFFFVLFSPDFFTFPEVI